MTSRDIGDISTYPGGRTGALWTEDARDSLAALWALNGGMLAAVAGTNTLSASLAIPEGFTSYSDGLYVPFIPANSNTGPATLNIQALGAKALVDPDGNPLSAGAIIAGRLTEVIFNAGDDHFRLVTSGGTTNVTVQGGIMLQRSPPSRLAAAAGPDTAATTVGSLSFQCLFANSRVIIEGSTARVTGAGSPDVAGIVVALFVDGVSVQSFTDHCAASSQATTPFYFAYLPGNTDAHTYAVKVSSVLAATYPKGSNVILASEMSPNA